MRCFFRQVLNAFRHQRNDHSAYFLASSQLHECSTPSGIKGTITGREIGGASRRSVLNAFRHQRNDHDRGHPQLRN